MKRKSYSSDLYEQEWQHIVPLITTARAGKWPLVEVVNGILYRLKNECLWHDLPGDFPPWQTVYYHFKRWVNNGTWWKIYKYLISSRGKRVFYQKSTINASDGIVFDLAWMKDRRHIAHLASVRHAFSDT
jgi:transposase